MTKKTILALVVASSTSLQNGLLALMTTIPQVRTIFVAEGFYAALRMVENHQPALIILDSASLNRINAIPYEFKGVSGHFTCVHEFKHRVAS